MTHHLRVSQELPVALDRVFPFFARAENLQRITPPELKCLIVTPTPITMAEGTIIDYQLRLLIVPFRWRSRISTWDPPYKFVDEQVAGPYREWVHTHEFTQTKTGTIISDHVQYRLPLFPFGELSYPMVRLQLARIFAFRRVTVRQLIMS
jgi:ligand-binding SRPBCC domain-containing protein